MIEVKNLLLENDIDINKHFNNYKTIKSRIPSYANIDLEHILDITYKPSRFKWCVELRNYSVYRYKNQIILTNGDDCASFVLSVLDFENKIITIESDIKKAKLVSYIFEIIKEELK